MWYRVCTKNFLASDIPLNINDPRKTPMVRVNYEFNMSSTDGKRNIATTYFTFHRLRRIKVGLGTTFVRRDITESMKILNRPDRPI